MLDLLDGFVEVTIKGGRAVIEDFQGDIVDKIAGFVTVGAVICPTETVYGVIAKANRSGLETIARAKGRSIDQLPPVLISDFGAIEGDVRFESELQAQKTALLIDTFWPGSLTLVLPILERTNLPSNRGVVAVRQTPNRVLAEVSRVVGPLYASSANIHGASTITCADDLVSGDGFELLSRVGVAYCSSPNGSVLASTIVEVKVDGSWLCHREGAISIDSIAGALEKYES